MQVTVLKHNDGSITVIECRADKAYVVRDFDIDGEQIGSDDNHGSSVPFRELFDTASLPDDDECENYVGYETYESVLASGISPHSFGYREPQ